LYIISTTAVITEEVQYASDEEETKKFGFMRDAELAGKETNKNIRKTEVVNHV